MPFKDKSPHMQALIDGLTKRAFGTTTSGALKQGICVVCKRPAIEFRGNLSQKEYTISGMCQKCQDEVFNE